jgi:hypothetical protein
MAHILGPGLEPVTDVLGAALDLADYLTRTANVLENERSVRGAASVRKRSGVIPTMVQPVTISQLPWTPFTLL